MPIKTLLCPKEPTSEEPPTCDTVFDCLTSQEGFVVYEDGTQTVASQPYDCTRRYQIVVPWVGCNGQRPVSGDVRLSQYPEITFSQIDDSGSVPLNVYDWIPPSITGSVTYQWGNIEDPSLCSMTLNVFCDDHPALSETLNVVPGYPGHGDTVAGRGGQVIKITNRNDSGPGSLRSALEASGARILVFDVGGVFTVTSPIIVTNSNLSVYGKTAPGGGVTVTYPAGHANNSAPIILRAFDILMMDVRGRPIPAAAGSSTCCLDAISIDGRSAGRISLIHCSFSFATDENLEVWYGLQDLTVACCVLAQGMRNSTGSDPTDHNYSAIFGNNPGDDYGRRLSFYWNLMAHNIGRNPRLGTTTDYDVWQNVSYNQNNFGFESDARTSGQPAVGNIEDNVHIDGPDTPNNPIGGNMTFGGPGGNQAFISNNTRERMDGSVVASPTNGSLTQLSSRNDCPRPASVSNVKAFVLANAGARNSSGSRDGTDERIVSEVNSKTGTHDASCVDEQVPTSENNNCQFSVPFLPAASADGQPLIDDSTVDCVPNQWKIDCGLPSGSDTTQQFHPDGYSYWEHWYYQTFGL